MATLLVRGTCSFTTIKRSRPAVVSIVFRVDQSSPPRAISRAYFSARVGMRARRAISFWRDVDDVVLFVSGACRAGFRLISCRCGEPKRLRSFVAVGGRGGRRYERLWRHGRRQLFIRGNFCSNNVCVFSPTASPRVACAFLPACFQGSWQRACKAEPLPAPRQKRAV